MTTTNGFNKELECYIDGWSKMMINIWKERMDALGINDTGALRKSLRAEVYRQSGGATAKIRHFFLYYGIYVNEGTGVEMGENGWLGRYRGWDGKFREDPVRKPKPWMSGKYWHSKEKLKAEMLKQTGRTFLTTINSSLTDKS